jgi:hypothetical protein
MRPPAGTRIVPLPSNGRACAPSWIRTRPAAPAAPPERPRAGWARLSKVAAEHSKGAPSRAPITMRWARPPRQRPAPPESARYSLCQKTSGACASVTSTGMPPTPLGNAVVDSPSLSGRAPVPPRPTLITLKGAPCSRSRLIASTQMLPADSAGTRPPIACSRHPNIRSGSICPTTWRAVTGLGRCGWTMLPSGARTSKGSSEPALLGTSGATMHFRPNTE